MKEEAPQRLSPPLLDLPSEPGVPSTNPSSDANNFISIPIPLSHPATAIADAVNSDQITTEKRPCSPSVPPENIGATASDVLAITASSASTAAATTKIPVRPSKTRKLSNAVAIPADHKSATSSAASTTGNRVFANKVFVVPLPRPLSVEGEVAAAIRHLRASDPALAAVIDCHEPPTFQSLHPPFHSLTRSILYQQLAFKAATAIYSRFLSLCGGEEGVVPETVLGLSQNQLRQIGVSERKASYLYDLAHKYRCGILSDASIVAMDDKSLFTMLTMVKGIGAWSVHMFMIFSLHRPDVLPVGDLGVRKGVQLLYNLDVLPRPSQMEQLCERWRPYRSIGAWYMWRLVETKGTTTMASAGLGGQTLSSPASLLHPLPLPLPPVSSHQQQQMELKQPPPQQQAGFQQHAQFVQPIQGFPDLG